MEENCERIDIILTELDKVLKDKIINVVQLISIDYNEAFYHKCGLDTDSVTMQYKRPPN